MNDNAYASPMEIPFGQSSEPTTFSPEPAVSIAPDSMTVQPELKIAEPTPEPIPNLMAYAKEISPSGNWSPDCPDIEFDVVLNVTVDNTSSTIVKKIKFCKYKLAQEMSCVKPATFVEEKKPEASAEQSALAKRLRELYTY